MDQQLTAELRTLKTQLRFLFLYALILTLIVVWLALKPGHSSGEAHFKILTAEQVNIVEPEGKVKLALFNKEHIPAAVINGSKLSLSGGAESGLMFYNEATKGMFRKGNVSAGGSYFPNYDKVVPYTTELENVWVQTLIIYKATENNCNFLLPLILILSPSIHFTMEMAVAADC